MHLKVKLMVLTYSRNSLVQDISPFFVLKKKQQALLCAREFLLELMAVAVEFFSLHSI